MKGKKIREFFTKKRAVAACCGVLAAALVAGSAITVQDTMNAIEVASYVDPIMETSLEEEETPLASTPKVTTTTKTSTKSSSKTTTISKAATKTYTKTLPTTSKTSTKTTTKKATASTTTVKTQTTTKTAVTEKYTKGSKKKNVTTKVTTTVKTTTTVTPKSYEVEITKLAPKMDSKVTNAFKTLGFKIIIDPSVSYSGYFNAKNKTITLKKEDDTIYHELGHFLAFVAGNYDTSSSFKSVYNAEKSKYTGVNKAYVIQNSSEYFAESVRDYILNKVALKKARPKTYAAVEAALKKVTTAQVSKIKVVLSVMK